MCGTCSNFSTNSNIGLRTWSGFSHYSNFTEAELRHRCSQELNTTADSLIMACVAEKKKQLTPVTGSDGTPQWVGYVQGAGNILSNAGNILAGLFGNQNQPQGPSLPPPPPAQEPKGLGIGAWIGIIVGVIALGGIVWYVSSKNGKK